jgi:sucrose phosphorylase
MIIVGAYPDGLLREDGTRAGIADLTKFLDVTLPPEIGLHLLPFYPSSGDSGFAIDDWFVVRPELGTWSDIRTLASRRPTIVDGVYNHVSMNHKWVTNFLSSPGMNSGLLHAYKIDDPTLGPTSPRGQFVLRRYELHGEIWHLWQTFSRLAVDVRLDRSEVLEELDQHLELLRRNNIWGVRLDAIAYYSKYLGSKIRHNPGVLEIADSLARHVEDHDMRLFAQLDCDGDGQQYFSQYSQRHYVVNDFSYAIYLALAVITGDPHPLARHLKNTSKVRNICLRSPRTHDGLLLRSGLLLPDDRARMLALARQHGVAIRMSGDDPYELNASAPFLYLLGKTRDLLARITELAVAVTGMTSGWSYFYLPFLLGHVPEEHVMPTPDDDPRELNRTPLSNEFAAEYKASQTNVRLSILLSVLSNVHSNQHGGDHGNLPDIPFVAGEVLSLKRGKFRLLANFGTRTSTLSSSVGQGIGELLYASGDVGSSLGPMSFGIWRT